jgi:hypothetical protein
MAFDPQWLAVGGLAVAAVAAAAQPVAGYFTTRAQLDHQRKLAAIERRQRRLEATYRGTIEYLMHQRDWVAGTEPFMTVAGEPAPPGPMDAKDLADREADVVMNGSPAVLAMLRNDVQLAGNFKASAIYLRAMRESHAPTAPKDLPKAHEDMEAARAIIFDAIAETMAQINTELREE